MVHGTVTMADPKLIRRAQGVGEVGFGRAHRVAQALPPREVTSAIAEDSVQPVPWVFRVAMRGAVTIAARR